MRNQVISHETYKYLVFCCLETISGFIRINLFIGAAFVSSWLPPYGRISCKFSRTQTLLVEKPWERICCFVTCRHHDNPSKTDYSPALFLGNPAAESSSTKDHQSEVQL